MKTHEHVERTLQKRSDPTQNNIATSAIGFVSQFLASRAIVFFTRTKNINQTCQRGLLFNNVFNPPGDEKQHHISPKNLWKLIDDKEKSIRSHDGLQVEGTWHLRKRCSV